MTSEIGRRAGELGFAVPAEGEHGPHMLGIQIPRKVARSLGEQLKARGVVASVRGGSLRIAPHLHTTQGDIDRLVDSLASTQSVRSRAKPA